MTPSLGLDTKGIIMESTNPEDFSPLRTAWSEHGLKAVFPSPNVLDYHLRKVEKDLMQAGAMARVGSRIYLHKTRFWPEYQRIMANLSRGEK